jgi:hypothetical protein
MSKDPLTTFAGLLRGCISDRTLRNKRREALEGAALVLSGIACSFLTSYVLAVFGVLV